VSGGPAPASGAPAFESLPHQPAWPGQQ